MTKKIILIISASTLVLTWVFSLREVRVKIGDYYFSKGNYHQAIDWYGKAVRKEKLGADKNKNAYLKYMEFFHKLKSTFGRVMDEKIFEISQHLGFENVKDVTLKNVMKNLLMVLDFSNIAREGNENYVVALLASKVAIENYSNSETKTNYLVGWIKEKLRIEGAARQVDGPWKDSKALMIEGLPGLTKIFGPPSAINASEGSLAVWASLTNSGKTYSDLVNVPGIIYIFHQGNGKFIVNYNGAGGSTDLVIKDDNWYHYVFTWKDRNQRFYINGLEALAGTVSAFTAGSAGTFAIGWLGYGNADKQEQWHGPLAKFLTFDRALTPTEVTALYRWRRLLQEN